MEREADLLAYLVNGHAQFGRQILYFPEFWQAFSLVLLSGSILLMAYHEIMILFMANMFPVR